MIIKTTNLRRALAACSLLVAFPVLGSAQVRGGLTFSGSTNNTTPLPETLLPNLSSATLLGNAPGASVVNVAVSLKPRDTAGLEAFCNDVSNPRSPNFRHFITPEEVGSRFGATTAQVQAVKNYLASKGFTVTLVAKSGLSILAQASVTNVNNAFSTSLKRYTAANPVGTGTITFTANSTALRIPTSLASSVLTITGVETYTRPKSRDTQTLTPLFSRVLYNTQPSYLLGNRGEGRTIGVSNFDGYRLSNIAPFVAAYNLPVPPAGVGTNVQTVVCGSPAGTGAEGFEGDLDFEMELATAPLATILIYDGTDLISVLTKEADENRAEVISESYGWNIPSGTATAAHNLHLTMTAQGQTYLAASGDYGTTIEPFSYPNYDTEVLMVGGTVATVNSSTGARVSEVGWSGSGGGWSENSASFNKLPSWQVGNGVPTSPNRRLCPDVAGHASGAGGGYFMYYGGAPTTGDGTSFTSPMFTGCLATLAQRLEAAGLNPRLGRINDFIYSLNGDPTVFLDITSGSNGILPDGSTSTAHAGWDFVTGWGAPDFDGLYNAILATNQNSNVAIDATAITPLLGNFIGGDLSSIALSDDQYYAIGSVPDPTLGQAAGAQVDFNLPSTTTAAKISVEATGGGTGGATMMCYAFNWSTSQYELVGSVALPASGDNPKTIKIATEKLSSYVDGSNNMRLYVRCHIPKRPFSNGYPPPFAMDLDQLQLLTTQSQ